jgi:hypothetical protein
VNERQWFTVVDAPSMLAWASERASERKLRLFAIACCGRLAHQFDARFVAALIEAAKLADETPPKPRRAGRGARGHDRDLLHALAEPQGRYAALFASERAVAVAEARGMGWAERAFQASCLIDLMGNPFRKVRFDAKWRTETAVALAQQFYERGEAASLPILADALEEAGCDEPAVLAHARDIHQPHVRGCWVVDLVLGKEWPYSVSRK